MDELDGDTGEHGRVGAARARQVHEQRPQAFAARGERLAADLGHDALVAADRRVEPVLELRQIRVEARRLAQLGAHGHDCPRASAVCNATIPPANLR